MIAYYPSGTSGAYDRWTGVPIGQPSTPAAVRTGVADAAHFALEVESNLLASINAAVASPFYRTVFACVSGLTTGQPVYLTDANTVALAAASGSGTSKVVGFVRDRTAADTGCYIAHFWAATGLTVTTGATVYLTNAGGFSITAGTFRHTIGIGISTTGALLHASPLDATLSSVDIGGDPATVGSGEDSGSATFAARADHKHALQFSGYPTGVGGAADSGTLAVAARVDHIHALTFSGYPTGVGGAAASGTLAVAARVDHIHALTFSGNPTGVGGAAASGTLAVAARVDHIHALTFSDNPTGVGTGTADSGTLAVAARVDHVHAVDSGLAKEILVASISGNAESGNYRAVTVALKDVRGNSTGARVLVEAWISDTGVAWETAGAVTGFTVASGVTGDTPTANKRVRGLTSSDGTITFHVTTDAVATFVFHVSVQSKIYYATLAFA